MGNFDMGALMQMLQQLLGQQRGGGMGGGMGGMPQQRQPMQGGGMPPQQGMGRAFPGGSPGFNEMGGGPMGPRGPQSLAQIARTRGGAY